MASAPHAPSTWKVSCSRAQMSAIPSRSSMAPVSTVPAVPTTRNGAKPGLRSESIGCGQGCQIHAKQPVHGNQPQRIASEAGEVKRSRNASVNGDRRVGDKLLRRLADARKPNLATEPGIAGYFDGDKVRHRSAGDKQARRPRGKPKRVRIQPVTWCSTSRGI